MLSFEDYERFVDFETIYKKLRSKNIDKLRAEYHARRIILARQERLARQRIRRCPYCKGIL